jgi:hypothetical protein
VINEERKRDSSASFAIKTFVGTYTTGPTVVLKTGYR